MAGAGKPVGLAIAGLGMAGAVMVRAAAAHPGVKLVAAAETHPAPREAFARDFNVRVYDDISAICADPAVEVVYIATPHQFHAPHAVLAAQHGKHVILEKPMALTLADCDAIIAAVEKAGVYLIVGHTHAFDPAVREMRRIVASGELGPLGMIAGWNYTNFLYRPRRPEELDTARGAFIVPTTTPTQFDPEQLAASIDRMADYAPEAMYLMHFSRVTDVPRLAGVLKAQIREFVRIAESHASAQDRYAAIRDDMLSLWLGLAHEHGVPLSDAQFATLLQSDLDLNTQGLVVWLDRLKRS